MTITSIRQSIEELKKVREVASPGPMAIESDEEYFGVRCVNGSRRDPAWRDWFCQPSNYPVVGQREQNAEFIALAANNWLSILTSLEKACEALEKYSRQHLESCSLSFSSSCDCCLTDYADKALAEIAGLLKIPVKNDSAKT